MQRRDGVSAGALDTGHYDPDAEDAREGKERDLTLRWGEAFLAGKTGEAVRLLKGLEQSEGRKLTIGEMKTRCAELADGGEETLRKFRDKRNSKSFEV